MTIVTLFIEVYKSEIDASLWSPSMAIDSGYL